MPKSTGAMSSPAISSSAISSSAISSSDGESAAPRHEITRRLSDKILTAFNHAYAIGETEIADKLRDVLDCNEKNSRVKVEQRGNFDPIGHADLWVEFVEARNLYKTVCDDHRKSKRGAADKALEAMKDAYRRWSVA